jgi:HEAT repeat protein
MTVEIGFVGTIALFLGGLVGSGLLFHFFAWWGRAAALSRARRIAARLREPALTLTAVEDHSAAIDELVQFGDGEAAAAAARELLDGTDGALRSAAIEILRRTRALDRWARDLRRSGYRTKLRAIEALGQVGDERAVAELIEALGDDDSGVAQAASQAVTARDPDYAADRLADALSSPSRRVAETAAATLVRMGADATEALVGQLASLQPQARRLAIESLGAVGGAELADLLLPLVEIDPDAEVRAAAAEALARAGGERAIAQLRRLAQSDPDWFVRGRAYCLLAEMNAPGAARFLLDALAALQVESPRVSDLSDAVDAIGDGTRRVQTSIIVGLRALGLSEEEVARAQRLPEAPDREMAAVTDEGATADLWLETIAALTGQDPARRAEAARQLAEAGPLATSALRRALRDPEPVVRAEAARSLGRIGSPGCLEGLAACVRDPDSGVRLASSIAMRAIITRDAARELRE